MLNKVMFMPRRERNKWSYLNFQTFFEEFTIQYRRPVATEKNDHFGGHPVYWSHSKCKCCLPLAYTQDKLDITFQVTLYNCELSFYCSKSSYILNVSYLWQNCRSGQIALSAAVMKYSAPYSTCRFSLCVFRADDGEWPLANKSIPKINSDWK